MAAAQATNNSALTRTILRWATGFNLRLAAIGFNLGKCVGEKSIESSHTLS